MSSLIKCKKLSNIVYELDKLAQDFDDFGESKFASQVTRINDGLTVKLKSSIRNLKKSELNDYQKFVKKELSDEELDSQDDFDKLPDLMKDISEKWKEEKDK